MVRVSVCMYILLCNREKGARKEERKKKKWWGSRSVFIDQEHDNLILSKQPTKPQQQKKTRGTPQRHMQRPIYRMTPLLRAQLFVLCSSFLIFPLFSSFLDPLTIFFIEINSRVATLRLKGRSGSGSGKEGRKTG